MSTIRVGIINDTRNAHHMGCWLVMRNLFRLLRQHDMTVSWSWPTGRDWREDPYASQRGNVDLVIVNAEGSIHDSHQHHLAERFASIARHFNSQFDLPCVLINSTLYNNEPSIYELLIDYSLIYTRDSFSAQLLESQGINTSVVSDLTLAFPAHRANKAGHKAGWMVTDSASKDTSSQLQALARTIETPYCPIQFSRFPHPNRLDKPRIYLGKVRRWAADKVRHRPSLNGYMNQLCRRSLVVTGRYHAVTMCLLTRTPFVAVESLVPKISWLLQDIFGSTRRVFSSVDSLTESAEWQDARWTDDELARLNLYLEKCHSANQTMVQQIRRLV